jgi:hypothetical protein
VHRLRGQPAAAGYLNRAKRRGRRYGCGLIFFASSKTVAGNAAGRRIRAINIVVLQADDQQFGLVVDEINDTEEIVVKPLGKQLKSINLFAGATIMGDGKVALILDVLGLAQCAHVVSEVRDHGPTDQGWRTRARSLAGCEMSDRNAVLLFQHGARRPDGDRPLTQGGAPGGISSATRSRLAGGPGGGAIPRADHAAGPGFRRAARARRVDEPEEAGQESLQVVVYAGQRKAAWAWWWTGFWTSWRSRLS